MKLVKQIAAATALLVSLGLAAGCTPQRKPLTPGNPPSVTQPNPNTNLNNYGAKARNNMNQYTRSGRKFLHQFGANQNQMGGTDQFNRNPYGMPGRTNQGIGTKGRFGTINQNTTNQTRTGTMFGASSLSKTNNIATSIARRLTRNPYIDKATVVILGRTAYIAVDLKNNVRSNKVSTIKKSVTTLAKRSTPAVNSVVVVTDPDSLTRIQRIASGIASGNPISTFTRELSEIGRRLTPTIR